MQLDEHIQHRLQIDQDFGFAHVRITGEFGVPNVDDLGGVGKALAFLPQISRSLLKSLHLLISVYQNLLADFGYRAPEEEFLDGVQNHGEILEKDVSVRKLEVGQSKSELEDLIDQEDF